jgi:hypothetical protein
MNTRRVADMDGDKQEKPAKALRAALAFGVIAATIEMGIVLWFMYC